MPVVKRATKKKKFSSCFSSSLPVVHGLFNLFIKSDEKDSFEITLQLSALNYPQESLPNTSEMK